MPTTRLVFWLCILCPGAPALAQAPPLDKPQPLAASSGAFGIGTNGASVGYGLEYRFLPEGRASLHAGALALAPAVGVMMTSKHAFYMYAGLRSDLRIGDLWTVTPGFSVGTYAQGHDVDLGGGLEFRSDLEVVRSLGAGWRAGLALQHMSNGRLYTRNPGANTLTLIIRF